MVGDLIARPHKREEILPVRQGSGAEVLPDRPYEIYDDERGSRFLGLYTLDSYDGGQVDVSVAGRKGRGCPTMFVETVDVFTTIDDPEALAALDMIAIDARDQRRPLGIIYRVAAPGRQRGWQVAVTDGTVGVVSTLSFRGFLSQIHGIQRRSYVRRGAEHAAGRPRPRRKSWSFPATLMHERMLT